jgi:Ser/Thr protein kinase RdoA (MazF antagonist)
LFSYDAALDNLSKARSSSQVFLTCEFKILQSQSPGVIAFNMLKEILSEDQLSSHLKNTYAVQVQSISKLDLNVYHIHLISQTAENQSWVVRVYRHEDQSTITSLSQFLNYLTQQSYPAEESIVTPTSSSQNPKACILATKFASGHHPERNRATFFRLGRLLGQLHTTPIPANAPKGGAWHHLAIAGDIRDECSAAAQMLSDFEARTTPADHKNSPFAGEVQVLQQEFAELSSAFEQDLPKSIVHPDFVPVNIIEHGLSGEGSGAAINGQKKWTVVDWTGAGVGYRVVSLGFLLGVAGARGKMILVDEVMKGYGEFVKLEECELEVLPKAVYVRFFTLDCWQVAMERKEPKGIAEGLKRFRDLGDNVAKHIRNKMQSSVAA